MVQCTSGQRILSLYENNVHVIVAGKAGADVEFGNSLFVAKTREDFILDHELLSELIDEGCEAVL